MNTFRIMRTDRQTDDCTLAGESLLIGRANTSDLQLPHPAVAPAHAGIKFHEDAYWLSALAEAATHPVRLNDAVVQQAPLSEGDTVRIGPYLLRMARSEQTLQITVDFALDLALPDAAEAEPPISAGTPADERQLERYWERRLQTIEPAQTRSASTPGQQPGRQLSRRWLAGLALFFLLGVTAAAWAFPTVYSPGPLSAPHTARTLPAASLIAKQASNSCGACHTLTGTMAQQCAACHSTPTFQATIAQKHLKLGLTCRACHTEHRGTDFKPDFVANAVCTSCHQMNSANGAPTLHGKPVSYPVKNGLWLWEGLSQTTWQQHGLPGRTVDYNLREQFHMLHAQGPPQGRTQCVDCHLGGTEGASLKRNVREACSQCHGLQPAFAVSLKRLAETQALQTGNARCVSCHAQHGAEKDLRASVRK